MPERVVQSVPRVVIGPILRWWEDLKDVVRVRGCGEPLGPSDECGNGELSILVSPVPSERSQKGRTYLSTLRLHALGYAHHSAKAVLHPVDLLPGPSLLLLTPVEGREEADGPERTLPL